MNWLNKRPAKKLKKKIRKEKINNKELRTSVITKYTQFSL